MKRTNVNEVVIDLKETKTLAGTILILSVLTLMFVFNKTYPLSVEQNIPVYTQEVYEFQTAKQRITYQDLFKGRAKRVGNHIIISAVV